MDRRESRKRPRYEACATVRAIGVICIGVDAFLTIRLMDDARSFTGASIESLKNDPAHRCAHIPPGIYRRSGAPTYRVYRKRSRLSPRQMRSRGSAATKRRITEAKVAADPSGR